MFCLLELLMMRCGILHISGDLSGSKILIF